MVFHNQNININIEFRKVLPSDYKLFQVVDLFCTVEHLKLKDKTISNSERAILGNEKDIRKNIINQLSDKRIT